MPLKIDILNLCNYRNVLSMKMNDCNKKMKSYETNYSMQTTP